jgi:peroxiredoxin
MVSQTFAEQRDEVNAALAQQAPSELLEAFGGIRADQAAVDYASRAPKVGERAPDFALTDQLGREVSLAGELELERGPVVLIFYRGEWCPYCNVMLRTYGLRAADFAQRGARLPAVSPQMPDNSLTMAEKRDLEFSVLSDEGREVIGSYGLKYDVTAQDLYKAGGADLDKFNGEGRWFLPAPAVFVIDRAGIVRFVSVIGNYRARRARRSAHHARLTHQLSKPPSWRSPRAPRPRALVRAGGARRGAPRPPWRSASSLRCT